MTLIKFFPTGSILDYEIRPGVFVEAEILGRTETIGRYRCRYDTEEGGIKDGVIDSHNLYDPEEWPHQANKADLPSGR